MISSLTARLRNRRNQDGFTLIELLTVSLIIGVLAAIGFPPVLANRATGYDDSVRADLPHYAVAMSEYRVDHGLNATPSIQATAFKAVKHGAGNHFAVVSHGGTAYCLLGYSESGTHNSPTSAIVITESDISGTASCPLTNDPSTLDWK